MCLIGRARKAFLSLPEVASQADHERVKIVLMEIFELAIVNENYIMLNCK